MQCFIGSDVSQEMTRVSSEAMARLSGKEGLSQPPSKLLAPPIEGV